MAALTQASTHAPGSGGKPFRGFCLERLDANLVVVNATVTWLPTRPAQMGELEAVVLRAGQGERSALEQVLAIVHPMVVKYCRVRLGVADRGRWSAEDVAQEICLAVALALPRYRNEGKPFMAFVYGIAAHKVADAHRSLKRTDAEICVDAPESVCADTGPEQHMLELDASLRMNELLAILPERDREILFLRVVVGLSGEETAAALGCTAGAVRVAQHRALAKLKARIMESGDVDGWQARCSARSGRARGATRRGA